MLCGLTCIIIMILNPFSGKYYVISYARAIELKKKRYGYCSLCCIVHVAVTSFPWTNLYWTEIWKGV